MSASVKAKEDRLGFHLLPQALGELLDAISSAASSITVTTGSISDIALVHVALTHILFAVLSTAGQSSIDRVAASSHSVGLETNSMQILGLEQQCLHTCHSGRTYLSARKHIASARMLQHKYRRQRCSSQADRRQLDVQAVRTAIPLHLTNILPACGCIANAPVACGGDASS